MVARKGRWFGADGAAPRFAWESLAFTAAVRFDRDGGDASSVTVRQSEHASIRQSAPEQRAPLSRGRSGAERSPAGVDAARILSLQRLAGNQAVTSMIAVQRYEAGEHAQFGAETGKPERTFVLRLGSSEITSGYGDVQAVRSDPNVIVMSYGEVIALGDFYKDFDQLAQACSAMGQQLFNPPDVSGWKGGATWANTATVLGRYNFAALAASQVGSDVTQRALDGALIAALEKLRAAHARELDRLAEAESAASRRVEFAEEALAGIAQAILRLEATVKQLPADSDNGSPAGASSKAGRGSSRTQDR